MIKHKNSSNVKVLKGIDLVKPIETGMNKTPKGEKTKKKIKKPMYKFWSNG